MKFSRAFADVPLRLPVSWDPGQSWYIWNNDGDGATLKNAGGTVISRCSYSNPGEVRASKIC